MTVLDLTREEVREAIRQCSTAEEAYRKAGYGNLIDAVERVATGQSGIRTINKGNGETKGGGVTPTKNTPAYQEADIQDIKYGLG